MIVILLLALHAVSGLQAHLLPIIIEAIINILLHEFILIQLILS